MAEDLYEPQFPEVAGSEASEPSHLATTEGGLTEDAGHSTVEDWCYCQLLSPAEAEQGQLNYSSNMASSSSNVVGVHYRVGKKIGEGSFGVIFEGTNLLNNQQVAIKFVRLEARFAFDLN